MSDHDLTEMDATAQAELVRSGEASPSELVEAAIERAERLNPELNAIIHSFYDEAEQQAAGELPDGPFRGVPFLLKDLGAGLAGQPIHLGMRALKEADFRLPVDTVLGARFRDAGFVTIGKTNVPELGILPTTEPVAYGATRNPWNLEHTPGGSSGGSGAAVAAGIVPVAHANDGGGSIRIPASHNGLVGLKPTRQRTSQGPLVGDSLSGLTEELVVSRSVRDTAAILEAVHGAVPGDPYFAPPPERPYTEEVGADPGKLRIGLTVEAFVEQEVDPRVQESARSAAALLEEPRPRGRRGHAPGAAGRARQPARRDRVLHDPLAGGPGRVAGPVRHAAGPRARARRRRAADVGAGRGGAAQERRPVPGRGRACTRTWAGSSATGSSAGTTCC